MVWGLIAPHAADELEQRRRAPPPRQAFSPPGKSQAVGGGPTRRDSTWRRRRRSRMASRYGDARLADHHAIGVHQRNPASRPADAWRAEAASLRHGSAVSREERPDVMSPPRRAAHRNAWATHHRLSPTSWGARSHAAEHERGALAVCVLTPRPMAADQGSSDPETVLGPIAISPVRSLRDVPRPPDRCGAAPWATARRARPRTSRSRHGACREPCGRSPP
jgi:hypothetical protein